MSQPIKVVVVIVWVGDVVTAFVYPRNLPLEFGQNRVRYLCCCFCFLCVVVFVDDEFVVFVVVGISLPFMFDPNWISDRWIIVIVVVSVMLLLIPDTYFWSLAKIGLVATEILLTLSLWWVGDGGCWEVVWHTLGTRIQAEKGLTTQKIEEEKKCVLKLSIGKIQCFFCFVFS